MNIEGKSLGKKKSLLEMCVATTLSSKLVGDLFFGGAKIGVDVISMHIELIHLPKYNWNSLIREVNLSISNKL
jgi:hypothetical protein